MFQIASIKAFENSVTVAFWKRLLGENLFQNRFTAQGGNGLIAFASSFPGAIKAFEISPGNEIICQKGVFLAK